LKKETTFLKLFFSRIDVRRIALPVGCLAASIRQDFGATRACAQWRFELLPVHKKPQRL
jgi:hypothetical protein